LNIATLPTGKEYLRKAFLPLLVCSNLQEFPRRKIGKHQFQYRITVNINKSTVRNLAMEWEKKSSKNQESLDEDAIEN